MILKKNAYKWHRWFSVMAIIPLTMWAASGLIHQAGAWFKPQFNKDSLVIASGLSESEKISSVIKNRYSENAGIETTKEITAFNHEYPARNKVLPVYQVALASHDNTTLYVDLTGGSIVSGSNDAGRSIHKWFGYLHKLSFLDSFPAAKAAVMILFSLVTLLSGWLGIYLYFLLPAFDKRLISTMKQREKHWHRRIGIATSVFMLLFAFTGLTHIVAKLYPGFQSVEKPFFDALHMYRFTEAISSSFRFWWLFAVSAFLLLLVFSGLILLIRKMNRNRVTAKSIRTVTAECERAL